MSTAPSLELEAIDPERFSTLRRMAADERHRVVVTFGGGAVPGGYGVRLR